MKHILNFQIDLRHKYETCVEAKLTRSCFQTIKRNIKPLDLIHNDICDFKSIQTRDGNKYFITFIDDCSKYCYVYLLKSKDETLEKFILYRNEVENHLNRKIKELRRTAVVSMLFRLSQVTAPYSPQPNEIAERKNRTLKEMMNAMLISSELS